MSRRSRPPLPSSWPKLRVRRQNTQRRLGVGLRLSIPTTDRIGRNARQAPDEGPRNYCMEASLSAFLALSVCIRGMDRNRQTDKSRHQHYVLMWHALIQILWYSCGEGISDRAREAQRDADCKNKGGREREKERRVAHAKQG